MVIQHIENRLKQAFSPLVLEIQDDSAKHAGHKNARVGGESHFVILLVSEKFVGLSRVQRHREVYKTLAELMNAPIHALSLKIYTPSEYIPKR